MEWSDWPASDYILTSVQSQGREAGGKPEGWRVGVSSCPKNAWCQKKEEWLLSWQNKTKCPKISITGSVGEEAWRQLSQMLLHLWAPGKQITTTRLPLMKGFVCFSLVQAMLFVSHMNLQVFQGTSSQKFLLLIIFGLQDRQEEKPLRYNLVTK